MTLFALTLALSTSCQKEPEVYDFQSDRVEATFLVESASVEMLISDNNQFKLDLWRGNTNGAATVPFTFEDPSGIFTPKSGDFVFADGEARASVIISYPDINNFGGEKYTLNLSIDDKFVSHSGFSKMSVDVSRKLTYETLGTGFFTSVWHEEKYEVEVQKAAEADFYRIIDAWDKKNYNFVFYMTNDIVKFEKQEIGFVHDSYGMVSFDPQDFPSERNGKVVTFRGKFVVDAGSFGAFEEILELP